MSTTYRRVGDEFVLNGTKHFISNGSVAHWYVAFATVDRKARHRGISAFVFPADLPGIKKHRMKNKLGQRAADTSEVVFEDVRVPKEALLGAEGTGFKIAMQTFDRSRPEIGAKDRGDAAAHLQGGLAHRPGNNGADRVVLC